MVSFRGIAALAGNMNERLLTRGTAVSPCVCNAAGETGSVFCFVLLPCLSCFESENPIPKMSNLGASGGLGIEGDLAFSWAP